MTRRVGLVSVAARHGSDALGPLEAAGLELVELYHLEQEPDVLRRARALDGCWAVVAGNERYDGALFDAAPALRAVVRSGVGYDAIDVDAAGARGVAVCIAPGANAPSVADLAVALALAVLRRLPELQAAVRTGGFRPEALGDDLAGATVGIVGLGRVGRLVAERLRGFGCRLLAAEPVPDQAFCDRLGIELRPLAAVLPDVDVLTLHTALTPETRNLIGAAELALLRPEAILVNTARGGLVDEAALLAALRSGRLAGAGLDVFAVEPLPQGHPLLELPSVVATGHAASFTRDTIARTMRLVVEALLDLDAGRRPPGLLAPAAAAIPAAGERAGGEA